MNFHQICNNGFGNIISGFCSAYCFCLNSGKDFELFIYSDSLFHFFSFSDDRVKFLKTSDFNLLSENYSDEYFLSRKDLENMEIVNFDNHESLFSLNCSLVKPRFISQNKFTNDRKLFHHSLIPNHEITHKVIDFYKPYKGKVILGLQYRVPDKTLQRHNKINLEECIEECVKPLGLESSKLVFLTSNRKEFISSFIDRFSDHTVITYPRDTPLNNGGSNWCNLNLDHSLDSALQDIIEFYILSSCDKVICLGYSCSVNGLNHSSTFGTEAQFNSLNDIFLNKNHE